MYLHKARGTLWMQAWGLRPVFLKKFVNNLSKTGNFMVLGSCHLTKILL